MARTTILLLAFGISVLLNAQKLPGDYDACVLPLLIRPNDDSREIREKSLAGEIFGPGEVSFANIPLDGLLPDEAIFSLNALFGLEGEVRKFGTYPVKFVTIATDRSAFEIADVLGRRGYFRGTPHHEDRWRYVRVAKQHVRLPQPQLLDAREIVPRNFVLPEDTEAFARDLALRQLRDSFTWSMGLAPESGKMLEAQTAVNEELLARIHTGQRLTLRSVQQWTRKILEASLPEDPDPLFKYFAWIIRGTKFDYPGMVNGKRAVISVDLTPNSFLGTTLGEGLPEFQAYSGDEVPEEFDKILATINAVGDTHTFEQATIGSIRYLRLRPTFAGVTRLGRALLDYSLMKAAFPPLPEDVLNPLPFFKTETERVQDLLWVYKRNLPQGI